MAQIFEPLSTPSDGLFENNPDKTSVEKFRFFHADEGKPLATPWQVALSRALILQRYNLGQGIILDPACGSGIQIAAYSEILRRPIVGIELNVERARASAVNFRTIFTERGDASIERLKNSKIIVGDGTKGEEIIKLLGQNNTELKIALLHLDPARPRNSREHSLSEMAPKLQDVFAGWQDYLLTSPNGPPILLDLSPRLSNEQMLEVESLVEQFWPNSNKTWTWTSRGRGRGDRLALWIGPIAEPGISRRFVRIPPDPKQPPYEMLGGQPLQLETKQLVVNDRVPKRGEFVSIIDSALVESGMAEDWLESLNIGEEYAWAAVTGRRPTIYHAKKLNNIPLGSEILVQCTGKIVDLIHRDLTLETVDSFVEICLTNDIKKLTIRANLPPELHPKLQGSFDRQLAKRHGSREAFLLKRPNHATFLLCITS